MHCLGQSYSSDSHLDSVYILAFVLIINLENDQQWSPATLTDLEYMRKLNLPFDNMETATRHFNFPPILLCFSR